VARYKSPDVQIIWGGDERGFLGSGKTGLQGEHQQQPGVPMENTNRKKANVVIPVGDCAPLGRASESGRRKGKYVVGGISRFFPNKKKSLEQGRGKGSLI